MIDRIEGGLDILRREARGSKGKHRNWKTHNTLMRRAKEHIEACGGDWFEYESALSREFAALMRL